MLRCRKLNLINLLLILLFVLIPTKSVASYVSYSNTSELTSTPYYQSGFGFSDGQGNSMSFTTTTNAAIYTNQYPNAIWVQVSNGYVPPNAIVLQYINGYPAYYCRVRINGEIYYGQLLRGDGCYVDDVSDRPFGEYQTLVR